ncbi:MAG TPA: alpha/beta hydrolase [Kofleriaceae bacterium]|nr:alpha/beta hydrolase [Kofleriaceae bacterium]
MKEQLMAAAVRRAMKTPWFVRLAGRQRPDPGLDRQIAAALEFQRIAKLPDLETMEPAAARTYTEAGLSPLDLDPAPMAEVIDFRVGAIPVRAFVPRGATGDWFVYFHGGGGVTGSIKGSDAVTRHLAEQTRATVASVDYRLAPEHKHPAGIDDANAAYAAIAERVPAHGKLVVGGDSFGGFLTAHVEHHARTTGGRVPDLQVLIYPIVDLTLSSPSVERLGHGRYLLTKPMIDWYLAHYWASGDKRDGSPWFWPDAELDGAASAIVVTAGFDPLVDEGDAWAARLRDGGATVRHQQNPSLVHGFLSLAGAVDAARVATDRICTDIVSMLRATASANSGMRGSQPSR